MLVGAFHVDIGDAVLGAILTVAQHEGMGRPAVEPHVENVENLIVILGGHDAGQEAFLCALDIPRIRALGLERLGNPSVDRRDRAAGSPGRSAAPPSW